MGATWESLPRVPNALPDDYTHDRKCAWTDTHRTSIESICARFVRQAQGGEDFKLFERLDLRNTGRVDLEAWTTFFRNSFVEHAAKKRLKGDKWLRSQLYSLRRCCGVVELSHEQCEDVMKTYTLVTIISNTPHGRTVLR